VAAFPGLSRKPHYRRKNSANIFYTDRVIVNFVPKFVDMATGVDRGEILATSSDSPAPKILGVGANSAQLSFTGAEL